MDASDTVPELAVADNTGNADGWSRRPDTAFPATLGLVPDLAPPPWAQP
jgi:hypothetical protein